MNRLEKTPGVTVTVTAVTAHDHVIQALEEAGRTLLALPDRGHVTHLRTGGLDFVREAIEGYGWDSTPIRPPVPSSHAIDRMDEVLSWISLIPTNRFVLRRIVGARALVHPVSDRHLFSWRKLGTAIGADHHAVQRWHNQGIDLIVEMLRVENKFPEGFQTSHNYAIQSLHCANPAPARP